MIGSLSAFNLKIQSSISIFNFLIRNIYKPNPKIVLLTIQIIKLVNDIILSFTIIECKQSKINDNTKKIIPDTKDKNRNFLLFHIYISWLDTVKVSILVLFIPISKLKEDIKTVIRMSKDSIVKVSLTIFMVKVANRIINKNI